MAKQAAPFLVRGIELPAKVRTCLDYYALTGQISSGFLAAVLCNDLSKAVSFADSSNLAALPAIVGYVYNELPSDSWGNEAKVCAWIKRGGQDALAA